MIQCHEITSHATVLPARPADRLADDLPSRAPLPLHQLRRYRGDSGPTEVADGGLGKRLSAGRSGARIGRAGLQPLRQAHRQGGALQQSGREAGKDPADLGLHLRRHRIQFSHRPFTHLDRHGRLHQRLRRPATVLSAWASARPAAAWSGASSWDWSKAAPCWRSGPRCAIGRAWITPG